MMDEKTALNSTTTTTIITKEKHGSTLLVVLFTFTITLLLSLAFYAGQPIHGGTSLAAAAAAAAAAGGGTTRGGASTAVAKKTTATPTSTPTLQMFIQQYPQVKDQSSEEQAHLYMVYKLHLLGATSKELDKYKTNAFTIWGSCCKDGATSTGCQITGRMSSCGASPNAKPAGINTECYWVATNEVNGVCCQYWPDNREGSQAWPWSWSECI